jgi:hypothetical protein
LISENRNQFRRKIDEFDYKLNVSSGVNAQIHYIYEKKIEDLKSLLSGKIFVKKLTI